MKFAKAVYCRGVDKWYVRLGEKHGIDTMFESQNEYIAKLQAKNINTSLNRRLRRLRGGKDDTRRCCKEGDGNSRRNN